MQTSANGGTTKSYKIAPPLRQVINIAPGIDAVHCSTNNFSYHTYYSACQEPVSLYIRRSPLA